MPMERMIPAIPGRVRVRAEDGQSGKEQEDVQDHGRIGDDPGEPVVDGHEHAQP